MKCIHENYIYSVSCYVILLSDILVEVKMHNVLLARLHGGCVELFFELLELDIFEIEELFVRRMELLELFEQISLLIDNLRRYLLLGGCSSFDLAVLGTLLDLKLFNGVAEACDVSVELGSLGFEILRLRHLDLT